MSLKYFLLLVREVGKTVFPTGTVKEKQCVWTIKKKKVWEIQVVNPAVDLGPNIRI